MERTDGGGREEQHVVKFKKRIFVTFEFLVHYVPATLLYLYESTGRSIVIGQLKYWGLRSIVIKKGGGSH